MTGSNDKEMAAQHAGTERRIRQNLRDIFEQAYLIAFPLLDPNRSGSSHFLHVALRDAFPHLHQQDIALLSVSVTRVFHERNKPVSK